MMMNLRRDAAPAQRLRIPPDEENNSEDEENENFHAPKNSGP